MGRIEAVRGDITTERVDAVVNAANSSLLGGGGVDGAIHRAGGPPILAECRALRAGPFRSGLPTGRSVATTAGDLPAGHVIHTVGPVYSRRDDRSALLASAYSTSLETARELGAHSVAFPAISAGVYGWPMDDAARVAVETTRADARTHSQPELIRFVLFSDDALRAFHTALEATSGAEDR